MTTLQKPTRVVVLGGSGFLGRYLLTELQVQAVPTLSLGSRQIDLTQPESVELLKAKLLPTDAVVFASCLTPDRGKDIRTAMKNLAMGEHVCAALQAVPCAHVVYISSDAVYADSETLVREDSRCEPSTLYGLGHLTRERMIQVTADAAKMPWLVVRPTLLYGVGDTHGSYGPNRFMKQIREGGAIKIFGDGEEQRDHVHIIDMARLLGRCLLQRLTGVLNVAKGESHSFLQVAELCQVQSPTSVNIERLPRSGPVTHRHFDVTSLRRVFPLFRFTPLSEGVAAYFRERNAA
jgi:nucleoside-diphosphate-sugar epimerase